MRTTAQILCLGALLLTSCVSGADWSQDDEGAAPCDTVSFRIKSDCPGANAILHMISRADWLENQRLPDDQRRVVELRHFDGRTHAEIADELGRSTAAVRMLWVRALRNLRPESK